MKKSLSTNSLDPRLILYYIIYMMVYIWLTLQYSLIYIWCVLSLQGDMHYDIAYGTNALYSRGVIPMSSGSPCFLQPQGDRLRPLIRVSTTGIAPPLAFPLPIPLSFIAPLLAFPLSSYSTSIGTSCPCHSCLLRCWSTGVFDGLVVPACNSRLLRCCAGQQGFFDGLVLSLKAVTLDVGLSDLESYPVWL